MAFLHEGLHGQRRKHRGQRGPRTRLRHTARGHVSVPDGLDLLDAMLVHDGVEGLEAGVQLRHQVRR